MTEGGDLLDRLRQVDPPGGSPYKTRWFRNPDGPEAATQLEILEAALREEQGESLRQAEVARDALAEVERERALRKEAVRDNREKTEVVRALQAEVGRLTAVLAAAHLCDCNPAARAALVAGEEGV